MKNFPTILCALVVFLVPAGEALKCHVCRSLEDVMCDTIKDERYLKDCSEVEPDETRNATNCRIEIFSAYSKMFEMSTERTVRSCGYEAHPRRSCYFSSNHDLKGSTCECFEDGCNACRSLHAAYTSMLAMGLCLAGLLAASKF